MPAETSQTLDRGLRLLTLLATEPDGLTVTGIAAAMGVSRTVVYRLVVTLEGHGLVRRGVDGRARLGLAVLSLARSVPPVLREGSTAALRRLSDTVGATTHFTVVDGAEALVVAVAEPQRADGAIAYRPGLRHPIDRGATGRAVAASRPVSVGEEAPYVVVVAEPSSGAPRVTEIAAPLIGVSGIDGAVGLLLPGDQHDPSGLGALVSRAAAEVARALR